MASHFKFPSEQSLYSLPCWMLQVSGRGDPEVAKTRRFCSLSDVLWTFVVRRLLFCFYFTNFLCPAHPVWCSARSEGTNSVHKLICPILPTLRPICVVRVFLPANSQSIRTVRQRQKVQVYTLDLCPKTMGLANRASKNNCKVVNKEVMSNFKGPSEHRLPVLALAAPGP